MKTTVHSLFSADAVLVLALLLISSPWLATADDFTLDTTRVAAAKDDPKAEYFLARQYDDGKGVPQDYARAVEYLRQSADQGYAAAQTSLGSCYARGLGVKQDYAEALKWYRKAAAQEDSLAQYCLGYAYACGKGVTKNTDEAVKWWQKSAKQGQVYAQNALGEFYFQGDHPDDTNHINYAAAAKWLGKAAGQGYVPAMSTLGYMYQFGIGVKRDWKEALKWNRPAAEQGDATAQDDLGLIYEDGNGELSNDKTQAYKGFLLSAGQGSRFGRHDAMELELPGVLTPDQIADAQRMVHEFHTQTRTNQSAEISN